MNFLNHNLFVYWMLKEMMGIFFLKKRYILFRDLIVFLYFFFNMFLIVVYLFWNMQKHTILPMCSVKMSMLRFPTAILLNLFKRFLNKFQENN